MNIIISIILLYVFDLLHTILFYLLYNINLYNTNLLYNILEYTNLT